MWDTSQDKKLVCMRCGNETIYSTHHLMFVCDACYAKGLGGDKLTKGDNL